jgi:AcrR family transcriptional regulator
VDAELPLESERPGLAGLGCGAWAYARCTLPGTADRYTFLVEASLTLFNERGTANVTTNHIAAHLSISPGKLYYHFRNKEEIIRTISPRFAEVVRTSLVLPDEGEITAADVGRYHLAGIEVLWQFRFLTRDPQDLVERDPSMAEPTTGLNNWLTHWFVTLFERLITQGHMRRPDPGDDLVRVAANAVILWSSWFNFVMTSRSKPDVDPSDVAEGALQSFLTFAPYLDEAFAVEVRAVLDECAGS